MIDFHPIPAFSDNYIWALSNGQHAVVVDPGDAAPVEAWLQQTQQALSGILITHYHPDHVMGLPALCARHTVPVWGPAAEQAGIPGLSQALRDGDQVSLETLGIGLQVMEVPGHTLGHIAYVGEGFVLCGDTLFSAGCGRLFEGTPAQMQASMAKLRELPPETRVYCTHEYTEANLRFAAAVEPNNPDIKAAALAVRELRQAGQVSLPSTIARECDINPFMRWDADAVIASATARGTEDSGAVAVFAAIRHWKDTF